MAHMLLRYSLYAVLMILFDTPTVFSEMTYKRSSITLDLDIIESYSFGNMLLCASTCELAHNSTALIYNEKRRNCHCGRGITNTNRTNTDVEQLWVIAYDGFEMHDIDGKPYMLYPNLTPASYAEASNLCAGHFFGGRIFKSDTIAKLSKVNEVLDLNHASHAWVGLNDIENPGVYVCVVWQVINLLFLL